MNSQPLVSIIVPTYNGAKYIKRAVESVRNQTYKNIEIIITDDASTDETFNIISELGKKDSRIIILTNEANLGFVKSLNKAAGKAQGKYITRIDDDDFWCDSRKLEKQVGFLETHPDYVLVGGGMIKIDENNREIARYLFPEKDKDIRKLILVSGSIAHGTVFFRKEAFEKVKAYDEQFGFFADIALTLKLGKIGKFYNFQEYFSCYLDKEENSNYKMRNYDIRRKVWVRIKLRKRHKNDYPGYNKAYLFCWLSYFYSFLPLRRRFRPFCLKLRKIIFSSSGLKENEKF